MDRYADSPGFCNDANSFDNKKFYRLSSDSESPQMCSSTKRLHGTSTHEGLIPETNNSTGENRWAKEVGLQEIN